MSRNTVMMNAGYVFIVFLWAVNRVSLADEPAAGPIVAGFAITALQHSHTDEAPSFVLQSELNDLIRDGGGGACASAAGIDALQTLRIMTGLPKLQHPHKVVLTTFTDQPSLLKGRVTNDEFARLLKFYQPHIPGKQLTLTVQGSPRSSMPNSEVRWDSVRGPDLRVLEHQLKIVTFRWTNSAGKLLGRHFVLLKNFDNNEITALDPESPLKDRTYTLQKIAAGADEVRFVLRPPAKFDRGDDFELDTVFTIAMLDDGAATPRTETLAAIKSLSEN